MTDSTRINELQDKMLQAMSIVNGKLLDTISYDTTITATISDNTDKADGKYILTNGSKTFTAYSTVTNYSNNTTVYVTIPNGNWENQKMIIGKKTSDAETPFNYQMPFDNFFALTANLAEQCTEGDLQANDVDDKEISTLPIGEGFITKTLLDADIVVSNTATIDDNNVKTIYVDEPIIDYARLGIKADFRSWVKDAVSGEYGLIINLTGQTKNITEEGDIEVQTQNYPYFFTNADMYGNTYNFNGYSNQEIVVNLSTVDIGELTHIKIGFYEQANFYDVNGKLIETTSQGWKKPYANSTKYQRYDDEYITNDQGYRELTVEGKGYYISEGEKLESNLFVKNIELYFGEDLSTYETDYLKIYTTNIHSYKRSTKADDDGVNRNKKNIKVRWVHLDKTNSIDMINGDKADELDYEIRWYRYHIGAPAADEYCGIYWDRINSYTDLEKELQEKIEEITKDESIDTNEKTKKVNEVTEYYNSLITSIKKQQVLEFDPDVNKQQEKVKVIVLYNNIAYYSNELVFTNEENVPLDAEAYHIINALMIDTDDNSNGNYLLYGQDMKIRGNDSPEKIKRKLNAYFDVNNDGVIDKEKEEIGIVVEEETSKDITPLTWIFPSTNSMLTLKNGQSSSEVAEEGKEIYNNIYQGLHPTYTINRTYQTKLSNNTVQCTYVLNGVTYTTEKEFTFGTQGTMGYDQTLVIDIVGDNNAVLIGGDNYYVRFQAHLYGIEEEEILEDSAVTWSWFYITPNGFNSDNEPIIPDGLKIDDSNKNNVIIEFNQKDFDINKLYILQVNVGDLETYFPIPIKYSDYSYIDGATQVVYQSNGEPSYSKEAYAIYTKNKTLINDVTWDTFDDLNLTITGDNADSERTEQRRYEGKIDSKKKVLQPLGLYVENAPVYGIKAVLEDQIIWSQPILVIQNKWPNSVVNNWNGKDLILDEADSSIVAAAIAAGKKNNDNTFSGVMIGDWKEKGAEIGGVASDITEQTGIYGFHHGAMSYAFKEDGTAFLGEDGSGRIYIDGDKATLYSNGYSGGKGMQIDLGTSTQTPYIDMKNGDKNYIKMGFNDDYPELRIQNGQGSILLTSKAGQSKISLQGGKNGKNGTIILSGSSDENPLTVGSDKFYVEWDGTLHSTGGEFKDIAAESGYLNNLDIKGNLSVAMNNSWSRTGPIYLYTYNKEKQMGYIGFILGATNTSTTTNIGIKSTNEYGVILESNTHARVSAKNSVTLQSPKNELCSNSDAIAGAFGICNINEKPASYTGYQSGYTLLYCTIPATNQFGIYARFA